MKRSLTHLTQVFRTLALIMTLGLTAYASNSYFEQHEERDATDAAATQPAAGHPGRSGHPGWQRLGHLD